MQVIDIQPTPNPNAMKFVVNGVFPPGSHAFMSAAEAEKDPLAKEIFALSGVTSVFYMNNFLTVSKAPNAAWDEIREGVVAALAKHGFRAT
ncbi:MAG: NifU N-terminal domain-containing protein [Chloroherpetonaceae bacterium]|nr:NifU N-terminal domain-containing protein [Chloroherpetonaceae bacterium]MDW8465186.1 NifU N-terminal domain-containing protein [Chloroherpetonaceae bacterium]